MAALTVIGAVSAWFAPGNDLFVTTLFYGCVWFWLAAIYVLARRGQVTAATWIFAASFWVLIAGVTLYFGGMQGQNASTFAVCTLLIGSVVGWRAALGVAAASSAWCAYVAHLEISGSLPPQWGPYSPINAWGTVTITVSLTTVLLLTSLQFLREAYAKAQKTAAERDEALRRAVQSQKMELVGNLTSGIAHDLNNLLTVIVGATDVLREEAKTKDDDARGLVEDLDDAASRAALMTRQLLAFGRTPADERQVINAGDIISAIGKMLPRVLGSAVSVTLDVAHDCWVLGARSGIEQIVLNLAVNARDAMPNGGTLQIQLSATRDQVILLARDTGCGIPASVRERVFEPFFTTKAAGTGLGLSTVRRIMDHHQGTIELERTSEEGTTFRLCFPRVNAPVVGKPVEELPSSPHSSRPRLRVLIVEDDPLVRQTLLRNLDRDTYDVMAVSNGMEALAFLRAGSNVQCIVSDVVMPQLDGESFARVLDREYPHLSLVLISGNREPSSNLTSRLRGTFLRKPFSGHDLRVAIQRVTHRLDAPSPHEHL
jgi:signal transduction histidine kinase/ActR/RegA family two-component response regulator